MAETALQMPDFEFRAKTFDILKVGRTSDSATVAFKEGTAFISNTCRLLYKKKLNYAVLDTLPILPSPLLQVACRMLPFGKRGGALLELQVVKVSRCWTEVCEAPAAFLKQSKCPVQMSQKPL